MSKSKGSKATSRQLSSDESDSGPEDRNEPAPKKSKLAPSKPAPSKPGNKSKASSNKDDDEKMFQLGKMRFATISEFRGRVMVGIREYYEKDGEMKPGKKGISLSLEQWNALKDNMDDIDEAIKNLD